MAEGLASDKLAQSKTVHTAAHPPAAGDMQRPRFDPGLTQQYTGALKRAINTNGQFNVRRVGRTWRDWHPYLFMINTRWPAFFGLVTLAFLVVNTLFAVLYFAIGPVHIKNSEASTAAAQFLNVFFFSAHTLTTVGYGNMWPVGSAANIIAMAEALFGVLGFAIATGLLFGRFSKPSARLGFSENMLIAPYMGGSSLQFRVVNRRSNNIIELEARMLLMQVEICDGKAQRRFVPLDLERQSVLFFPLTWTVVHPITETSPLFGKTASDLEKSQAEVMILMKGLDDTFGQTVHARYSYLHSDFKWGAKFASAFDIEGTGDLRIEIDKVGVTVPAPLA